MTPEIDELYSKRRRRLNRGESFFDIAKRAVNVLFKVEVYIFIRNTYKLCNTMESHIVYDFAMVFTFYDSWLQELRHKYFNKTRPI